MLTGIKLDAWSENTSKIDHEPYAPLDEALTLSSGKHL